MINITKYGPKIFIGKNYSCELTDFNKTSEPFFAKGFEALNALYETNNIKRDTGACIYLKWDSENNVCDFIVTYSITEAELEGLDTTGFVVTRIPEANAYVYDLKGSYNQLLDAHAQINQKLVEDNQMENNEHVVEEYILWSENEAELQTKIAYTLKN